MLRRAFPGAKDVSPVVTGSTSEPRLGSETWIEGKAGTRIVGNKVAIGNREGESIVLQ